VVVEREEAGEVQVEVAQAEAVAVEAEVAGEAVRSVIWMTTA
jgi:hypothetical protein